LGRLGRSFPILSDDLKIRVSSTISINIDVTNYVMQTKDKRKRFYCIEMYWKIFHYLAENHIVHEHQHAGFYY
jgi:hypothetical protein